MLPEASAKLVEGDCEPEVRVRRVIELVDPVRPAIDNPKVADTGGVDRDARRAGARAGDRPASEQASPRALYLKTLSVWNRSRPTARSRR